MPGEQLYHSSDLPCDRYLTLWLIPIVNSYNYNIVGGTTNPVRHHYSYPNYQQPIPMSLFAVPPPPNSAPPKVPIQQPIRRSLWEKIPQPEKTSSVIKMLNTAAPIPKIEKPKEDILEDKTLPDSVRKYILGGYAKCFTEHEKEQMRVQLRQIVGAARASGELHTRRWADVELPKLPREVQRSGALLRVPAHAVANVVTKPSPVQTKSIVSVASVTSEELRKRSERKTRFAASARSEPRTFVPPPARRRSCQVWWTRFGRRN